jgi:nucleoporin NUP159
MASQILGKQQGKASFQNAAKTSFMVDPNVEEQRRAQAKREKEEEEAQKLRDPMDEGIRQTLQAEIKPTLELDAFMAADSELPSMETRQKEPTGVQCETLWRDLNRMIDLVGLNSHSLQAFIQGHTTLFKEGGRTKEDLENHEDWVLVEAEDLGELVEGDLTRELEESRVKDIDQTHEAIRAMTRELTKLRAKQEDMHKIISSYVDPDQIAITKSLPLSAEQVTQRNEIRRVYASVIKLLSEAEESLTMLRAKMASIGGPSRKTGAPTVEAVIRTINKLTTMAEKRSGDVDVLEAQMRKMRLGTPGTNTPRPGSREGSPFVAGTPSKTPLRKSVFMSPSTFRDSFSSSVGVRGTPPRKKMSMYTEEERKTVLSKQAKRKGKMGMLRSALERAGPQVSTLEEE